jgi:membrane protein CcdC involved in cytochrome C biogenesis
VGHPFALNMHVTVTLGTIMMALTVIFIRLRAANKPTSVKKIIMPPIGMSTGFLMFLAPSTHIPWSWAACAFLAGAVFFSYPLIRTSKFHVENGQVYLKRSRAFILILLTLLVIRIAAHNYIEHLISIQQTAGVFFILAFGMILPWRVAMYIQYKKVLERFKRTEKPEQP